MFRREQPFSVRGAIMVALGLLLAGPAQAQIGTRLDTELPQGAVDPEAEKQMAIGRYYVGRRDYTGAINRFKLVVTHYPSSRHIDEALAGLAEAYLALGINCEAQSVAAVLARKFPDSRWSAIAADALKSAGLDPLENSRSCISQTFK
jgi:outer membrane protein assembly factor BamD